MATLVAGIAHEINNPITYVLTNLSELGSLCESLREGILAYRSELREAAAGDAEARIAGIEGKIEQAGGLEVIEELITDAMQGAVRIRDLVRDLLSIARPSETSDADVDTSEILESTLRLVNRQLALRAELTRDYHAERLIPGDAAKLGQVFLNLITNAIHACNPADAPHRITVRSREVEGGVEVEVEDTGRGIPEDTSSQIFLPFFTTKDVGKGTGLGLFISREIVQQHGGSIDFRPARERGTIFRVTLPSERPHGNT